MAYSKNPIARLQLFGLLSVAAAAWGAPHALTMDAAKSGVRGAAHAVVASPQGGIYAGGEGDGMVVSISAEGIASAPFAMAPAHSNSAVAFLATGPDGRLIAAGDRWLAKASQSGTVTNRSQATFPIQAMAVAPDGSIYVAGDHRIAKFYANLEMAWESTAPTPDSDVIRAIGVVGTSTVYAAGAGFVAMLSSDGREWVSRMEPSTCDAAALTVENGGSVYIAGTTRSALPVRNESARACVAKIDRNGGGLAWSATIDGGAVAQAIVIGPDGRLAIAGSRVAETGRGGQRGFAAQMDGEGHVLTVVSAGRGANSRLESIAVDSMGSAWVAGWSDNGVREPLLSRIDWNLAAGSSADVTPNALACTATSTVTSTADSGPGTLRDAVANACGGGVIRFSLPTPSTITVTSPILLPAPVTILGPGAAALTISGGGKTRIFYVTNPNSPVVGIDGMTLANGFAKGGDGTGGGGGGLGIGGAIFSNGGYLALTNLVFQNNSVVGGNGSLNGFASAGGGGGGIGGNGQAGASADINNGSGMGGAGGSGGLLGGTPGPGGAGGGFAASPGAGGQGGDGAGGGGGGALLGFYAAGGAGGLGGGGGAAGVGSANYVSPVAGGTGGFGGGGGAGATSAGGQFGGNGFGQNPNTNGGGGGGAGLGGAIGSINDPDSSRIWIGNVAFSANSATPGAGVSNQFGASKAGQGKGGALFGAVNSFGGLTFSASSAPNTGAPDQCSSGLDTADVCGVVSPSTTALQYRPYASAGDGQTAVVNSAFGINLQAAFFIPGMAVTFTAPPLVSGQPSGTFPGGAVTYTGVVVDPGMVTAPVFTANGTPGSYTVTATVGTTSVPFALVNSATPAAATLSAVTATAVTLAAGQSGTFSVLAKNAQGQPMPNVQVLFLAPGQGASGTFSAGAPSVTATTDATGIATSPLFKANYALGSYSVVATSGPASASFQVTNTIPVGSKLSKVSDTLTSFGYTIKAVLLSPDGIGIAGAQVHFAAPASGPSARLVDVRFNGDPYTGSDGMVSLDIVPNDIPGPYTIVASTGGLYTEFNRVNRFNLSLVSVSPTLSNVTTVVLQISQPFGAPVAGLAANFATPAAGPTGTVATLSSDSDGKVTATFTGNNIFGPVSLTASIPYGTSTVLIPVTNQRYSLALSPAAPAGRAYQLFPPITVAVTGANAGTLRFLTPSSSPTATINGGNTGSAAATAQGYPVPPLKANGLQGTWQLRVFVNPVIYQDFTLTNNPGNIATITSVTSSVTSAQVYETFQLTGAVNSGVATGKITFLDGGTPLGTCQVVAATSNSARCTITVGSAVVGLHNISGYYFGDANTNPSGSPILGFSITNPKSTSLFESTQVITHTQGPGGGTIGQCNLSTSNGTLNLFSVGNFGCANGSGVTGNSVGKTLQMTSAAPRALASADMTYPIGQGPHSITTADFNGDGLGDAAVTNQADGTVTIFLGSPAGGLQNGVTYPAGTAPTAIVTGDFNHDGNADWAVANAAGVISVALGFGDGTFALPIPFQASGSILVMAAGDMNNDGVTDLVTLDSKTGALTVYLNNGDGKLSVAATPAPLGFDPRAIVLRDFNGDGKRDLAIAYYQQNAGDTTRQGVIVVLPGNGDGTLGAAVTIPGGRPLSLQTGSFSPGGFVDLLAGYGSGGNLLLYPGKGDGTFGTPATLAATNASTILVGNFSGTGRSDIVTLDGSPNVQWLANQPTPGPDLSLTKSHSGVLTAGLKGAQYTLTVSNAGLSASSGTVTVKEQPPANMTITAMSGTGWTCTTLPTCTRADALPAGNSYPPISVTANIGAAAVSPLVNTATVSGTADANPKNNSASDTAILATAQTITFTPIASQIQGATVTLSATASSQLPVSFSSLTPTVCTVSGTQAKALTAGTCTVQAMQSGNSVYAPAPAVTQSFPVAAAFTITPTPATQTIKKGVVAGFLLQVKAAPGFTGDVTLSCSGGPTGSVCADFPTVVHFTSGTAYAATGVLFPANTPDGVYTVTFTGTSGQLVNTATAQFKVQ